MCPKSKRGVPVALGIVMCWSQIRDRGSFYQKKQTKKTQKTRNFSRLTGTFKNNDIPKIIFWCLTLMVKVISGYLKKKTMVRVST